MAKKDEAAVKFLSLKAVAAMLGICPVTASAWARKGKITNSFMVANRWIVRSDFKVVGAKRQADELLKRMA